MTDEQTDLFAPSAAVDFETCNAPGLLEPPSDWPAATPPSKELIASIQTHGVIVPLLVVEAADGVRELVSGAKRAAAAAEAGQAVPVRVLRGSRTEALCAALVADTLVQRCSVVERGWRVERILDAAKLEGREVTVRWLARELAISVGTAQTLLFVARHLPPERLGNLAEMSNMDLDRLIALPIRTVKRIAGADDGEAASLLRDLVLPKDRAPPPRGLRARLLAMLRAIVRWVQNLGS